MLTRRSLWLWFILLVLLFLTSGDLPAVAVETPGANRPNVFAVRARNTEIACGGTAGCVTARQVTSDHAALDEPHWLLTFPAGAHVDDYLPLLTELQDYELLRETVRLSECDIVQVTRLTPAARQRLLDAGVTILTDDAASRATLGLTPPDSCTPDAEEVAALTKSEIPSFVIDLMQDYVEGYVAPSKYVTATLRSVNNGVKAVSTNLSSSYDGQYRVCFLDMNLLPGDTVDVEVQGDGLRHFTAPTLTLTLNADTDVVSGIAPPNTVITVEVQSYATPIHILTSTTNLQGSYSVSFSGVYDLQTGTWGQVTLPGEQGERYRVSRYLPSRFSWSSRLNLNTLESVAAQVKLWNPEGVLQETIDGITNRIGSVCQDITDVAPGSRIQAEVAGVATAMRVPTILVEPGNPVVTGTADAGAEITCNTSGYPSVYTTTNAQGVFTCDFTGVYTPTQGARIEVTARLGMASAVASAYAPVGLAVSRDHIDVYTSALSPISLRRYSQSGPMEVITESMASTSGWFTWWGPHSIFQSANIFHPGDAVEVLSAGQSAQVRIPIIDFDVENNTIAGIADPHAEVRVRLNSDWSNTFITTTNASGLFTITVTTSAGLQRGDSVDLTVNNSASGSVSLSGSVPARLAMNNSSYSSGASLSSWPGIGGHWQIFDHTGQLRVEEVFTTTHTLSRQSLYPGDLISATVGEEIVSLRVPMLEADIHANVLSGLVQPASRVDLTLNGLWGNVVTQTLTATTEGSFTFDLNPMHNLMPGDEVRLQTTGPGSVSADMVYYIPARVRVYGNYAVYAYTAPYAPVSFVIRDNEQQIVHSETITAALDGYVYLYLQDIRLPVNGILEIDTTGYSVQYPLHPLTGYINRAADRITGLGPPNTTMLVEVGYQQYFTVVTDSDGNYTLNLSGQEDLKASSYATVRYFSPEGIEHHGSVSVPQLTIDIAANTVDVSYLPSGTPLHLRNQHGQLKQTVIVPAEPAYGRQVTFDDIVPGDMMEIAAPGETIVLTVPDIAVSIDRDADTITLQGTPGLAGTLSLLHNGVRRYESYIASCMRLGDDGRLDISLRGIYEIWNNTRASFCVALPEGDSACITAYASGLMINATYNTASGYAAPNSDVLLTVKRGTIPRGSALVRTDGVGAFSTRAFCQVGVPVDIAAEDQVVLQPATTLSVQDVSAHRDIATHTLSGIGLVGQRLWVRFYPQGDPQQREAQPDPGNTQEPYPCQIDCQPLPSAAPTGNTIYGQAIPVVATGHFSITHPSLRASNYAILTYEDEAGNLLQCVASSTSSTDLSVALTTVSEVAVIPSIHAVLDLESDTLYGIGPANAQLDIKFIFQEPIPDPCLTSWGDGGSLCAIVCQSLAPDNSMSCGRNIIQTSAEGQFSVQTAEYYTFMPDGEWVAQRWDLASGDYAIIRYEDTQGNLYAYIVSDTSADDLQVALQQVDTQLIVPYLTGNLNLESNTLTVSGAPGTRIQGQFVVHKDGASITPCPPDRPANPGAEPGGLCSLWCEPLQANIQYIFGGAIQIGATGTVVIPARADLQAGDYAVITYEDEQGNFLQLNVPSTFSAGLNTTATTIPPSVDAWQTLVLTWTVSGGVNHNVSQIYWDTSTHNCDHNYAHELDGARVTTGTYTATLTAPNADALYLRPYAEIDGHQVWAVQETVISINPPPPGADAYEPDDTCAQAHPILTDGTAQQRTFHQYADEDWVWFDVISNTTYTVFASQTGPQADVELDLYDVCTAAPVYTATNTFGPDARLVFTAPGSGRYYLQVYNHDPAAYGPDAHYRLAVRAERPRGLAIIVAGRMKWVDPLQSNINRAANRAYLTFLQRGYTRQDIHYLNVWPNQDVDGNGLQDDVAGIPTIAAIQATIETWTAGRGVGPGVPLYIYLMDHGEVDRFYADINQMVTAEQLNAWLTALEIATGADEITIIVDACNSGSFIDRYIDLAYPAWGLGQISAPNRVIVSSTSSQLLAYATPQGVLFSDAFWAGMREGRSVADSFMRGQTAVIESGHASFQTPWLDDNGNGSPNEPTDGLLAQQRGLLAPLGWEVPEIATVSVSPVTSSGIATITAQIYDNEQLALVEAQIIPPNYTPTLPDDASLPILEVPTLILQTTRGITYTGVYTDFVTPGTYRVVVYAWDETGLTALPHGLEVQGAGAKVYLPLILRQQ